MVTTASSTWAQIPTPKPYEPVSVKTGLNDIEMKIQITALPESINFSEYLLEIWEDYHYLLLRYGLWNHSSSAVSVNDVINVMQVRFDVSIITFVSAYFLCMLSKTTQTKYVFPHFWRVCDRTGIIICMIQHSFTNYRSLGWYTLCFQGYGVTMEYACHGNIIMSYL